MSSSEISPVRADEFDQWQKTFEAFVTHMSATLPAEQYKASWARIHPPAGKAPEMWCIVAREPDGSIVGLAQYMMFPRSWKETREVYLEDLFVLPSARGKGYGKKLLLAVAEVVAAQGIDSMHWTTGIGNVWSTRMYDRVAKCGHHWYTMDLPYKSRVEES